MKTSTAKEAAAVLVTRIAERLADPGTVAAAARAAEEGRRDSVWYPLSLADGFPAVALLYAELGHWDQRYRVIAHRYLSAAVELLSDPGTESPLQGFNGLFNGVTSIAMATRAAAQAPADYARLLTRLDLHIVELTRGTLAAERERLDEGRPIHGLNAYDVIGGLSGLGRYLLRPEVNQPGLVRDVLTYLVDLSRPVATGGTLLPGWWTDQSPGLYGNEFDEGHFNFGMAHGIPGPLALLALARISGHRVPGQDEAITRIVDWLLAHGQRDEFGVHWPQLMSRDELARGVVLDKAMPPSWCYGTPGIGRAVQLAGYALGRKDWIDAALDAARASVRRLGGDCGIYQPGLCHGWAGMLHGLRRINADIDDPVLTQGIEEIVRRLLGCADDTAPFVFRVPSADGDVVDTPGFLTGAAGVALALHSYATDTAPASGWDSALMLI